MIRQLVNPKTEKYLQLKEWVLDEGFAWYYKKYSTPKDEIKEGYTNIPFFCHVFLGRVDYDGYTYSRSNLTEHVVSVFREIFEHNKISLLTLLRLNANCVVPQKEIVNSMPHFDHSYPHKNILIYLTEAGGNTIVEGEVYKPKEDDIILFQGEHYQQTPEFERRIVLVGTYLDKEMVK